MSKISFFLAGLGGAALAYFLDAQNGKRRRNMTRDQLGATTRRLAGSSGKVTQYGGKAYGIVRETIPYPRDNPNPDDNTLRDRIESEIFKNPETSRKNMNVNVADGVVELRGELPQQQDIDAVVERVQSISDVKEVVSYLHLPGTPAPNEQSVLRVRTS